MEFVIISNSKMISPRFSHLLAGLGLIFNHFFYEIVFLNVIAGYCVQKYEDRLDL